MKYTIVKASDSLDVESKWSDPSWASVESLALANYMGDKPGHFPQVEAKLAYNDASLLVIFRVEDQYIRAKAENHQDAVCLDSCVEFFFTPGVDVSAGYFNLEMNCGGTMLLHFQEIPRKDSQPLSVEDIRQIELRHDLPRTVDPEIVDPTTWTVSYRLPFSILKKYFPAAREVPQSGTKWRGNFYKCADESSHPHWLTWAPVAHEKPDFHRPADFGELEFA